jgi:hypothetical protein
MVEPSILGRKFSVVGGFVRLENVFNVALGQKARRRERGMEKEAKDTPAMTATRSAFESVCSGCDSPTSASR